MQRYEKYKDSDVDWIGEIPEHWECKRLGTWFTERREKVSDKDYAPLSVTKNGVVPQLDNAAKSNDGDNRKLVKEGDFVINSRSDRKGSSGLSILDGSVSLINIVMKPRNINGNFSQYLLKSRAFVEEFYRNGHGIVADLWTTRFDEMKFINISVPQIEEQQTIASFLDDKTVKIDQTIANRQKEIELLKERRQILIQKAVTKGLDDTVKLRDSGVDWIGEIPEHWEVRKLKYVLTMRNEKTESKSTDKIYVGMENIESQTGKYLLTDSQVEGLASVFYKDDILFGKLRPYLAKVYLSEFDGICSTEFLVYKSSNASYYQRVLLSDIFIKLVDSSTYGAKMPRASADFINNISIPTPPEQEQTKIVFHLNTIEEKIAKAILLKQQEIEKLREYKTVLIDHVVTGKVRVSLA